MKIARIKLSLRAILFLAAAILLTGELIAFNSTFQVIGHGDDYTEIRFELQEYELIPVEIDGVQYYRLFHPDAGFIVEEGKPELLSFSVMVSVPSTGKVYFDKPGDLKSSITNNITIFPSQGFDLDIDEDIGFLIDKDFYQKDVYYERDLVQLSSPAIMRDDRLVSITVNPFSFNPAESKLQTTGSFTLRIIYDIESEGENELLTNRPRSRAFERILRNSVINYGQYRNPTGTRNDYQAPHIVMIYHNSAAFIPIVDQLADWKRDKGYKVTTISTAGINSVVQIRNYLQNAYNNWENRPEYVILVGGYPEIPTTTDYATTGDHPYTLLAGNDLLPDIILGRIAASNQTQLATVWNKIRNYEREPFLGNTAWYNNALLIGDRYASSLNTGKYVRDVMSNFSDRKEFIEHYRTDGQASNFATQTNNAINQGISYFMYRGYIGMSGWSPNDAALNNGYRLFHGTYITCGTLNTGTSSNAVNSVNLGAPNQAKGAITAIGMFTGGTNSAQNNAIQAAIYYGIFVEDLHTMGEAFVRAKLHLWNVYRNSGYDAMSRHLHWSNLIGDPSMYVWREIPKNLVVSYPQELPKGSNSIKISVTDDNETALENAWVTVRQGDDNILTTGYTDSSGSITHFFNPESTGQVKVTVTKFDYKPHLGQFNITDNNRSVSFHQIIAEDDFVAGEQIVFGLTLKNHSGQVAAGVNASIATTSEYIEIATGNSAYNNIVAGGTANSNTNFVINISPDAPAYYRAQFDLTVTDNAQNSWLSRFVTPIQNGQLTLDRMQVVDGEDGVLDPGEQAQLRFHLTNTGLQNLTSIYGRLSGGGNGFIITDSTGYFGDIDIEESVSGRDSFISVSVGSYVIPGTIFNVQLELYNEDGFSQTIHHRIEIGTIRVTDPLGPDEYGYWCFDEGDVDYVDRAEYEWIEIAPALGGQGTNTGLQSDYNNIQQTVTMDLPFTFRFYGEEYDVISICANGWISFKEMEEATQRNWRIPGPKVPMPVVAVFWDNLSLAQGGVFTWYDEENNLFVVQWQNALNVRNNAVETFQVILYDSMYYPTLTRDGPIKMQYRVFNNVNNSTGSPHGEWGNYCSIGIADHTGKVGIEYTFNNQYPRAARTLRNQSAIYWTTGLSAIYVAIESFSYSDDNNNLPEYNETGSINMTLANIGIEDGENVSAVLSTDDPYITILQNRADFGDIASGGNRAVNNAYQISIADNVPHNHRVLFSMDITADDNNQWNDFFYLTINAPELTAGTPLVYDPAPEGNNNGLIDPDEELTIYLPLTNVGGSISPEVEIDISSENNLAEILSVSERTFRSIDTGEILYPAIRVAVSDRAETGDRLVFSYTIETGNYNFEGQIVLGVGGLIPIQIGEGNTASGANSASPINLYYRSLRSQTIYTAAELEQAGMTLGLPMPINRLGYYITERPVHPLTNFIIRIKHTTEERPTSHDDGPFTTVFSHQNFEPTAGGWDMLNLIEPFQWNGVDNILVDTAFAPVPSWSSTGQVRIFEQQDGFRFSRADSPDQTSVETDSVSPDKPQILMMMGSDPEAAALKPQNLSYEFDAGFVNLQWEAPNEQRTGRVSRNDRNRQSPENRNPDGYNVYLNGRKINETLIEALQYNDNNFDITTVNYYCVTAVYDDNETLPSNIVAVFIDKAGKPQFSIEEGAYAEPLQIAITSETENSLIYYTLDGSEPSTEDFLYEEPVEIIYHTLLKAKAFPTGGNLIASDVASAQYYILYAPENVSASLQDNDANISWEAPWSPDDDDNRLFYSLNSCEGRNRISRNAYSSARDNSTRGNLLGYNVYRKSGEDEFIKINEEPIEALQYNDLDLDYAIYHYKIIAVYNVGNSGPSNTAIVYYGFTAPPVFSPEPGKFDEPVNVTISSQTEDAMIYYTLDNSEPTEESLQFAGEPISLDRPTTVKAVAVYDDWHNSEVVTAVYNIETTNVEEEVIPLTETQLHSAYPNPFNPETTISFDLNKEGKVVLEVFNIAGQKVKTIFDGRLNQGRHTYVWKGEDDSERRLGSGIYFYRLTTNDYTAVKKAVMLK